MLEDSTMERKSRSCQPQGPKGNGTDSKKNPDAPNSKQFPRNHRKRESPGGTSKNEPRRPNPTKTAKNFDKRPKPRGYNYGSRKESSQIAEEFDQDFGSVLQGGTKKQSLNHLLNFHYKPRETETRVRHDYTTKSLMSTHVHRYNKEQFLQANCQFVVSSSGDYNCYLGDPDLLVDWDLVELIRIGSSETPACPICLYPPTAGKITRCGHVFCWTCILHYLALSDKTWRKCPICYEAVHKNDLKSVECIDKQQYSVDQCITLQLMKREKCSLIAIPVNEFNARAETPILKLSENNLSTVFSKILVAHNTDIEKIIAKESIELDAQLEEFKGCPELCFVQQAVECLNIRKDKLKIMKEAEDQISQAAQHQEVISISNSGNAEVQFDYFENQPVSLEEAQDKDIRLSHSESSDGNEITVEDLYIANEKSGQPDFYYFYQSSDGQHIYMHSINLRMLEKTYGSLECCPDTISGKIIEKEPGSMTNQLRKRLKYLQHVPITCQFDVVELNLGEPIISTEVIADFKAQIEMRKKKRDRLAKAEKRREKKIAEVERKQYGLTEAAANFNFESYYHFPEYNSLDFKPPAPNELPALPSASSSRSVSPFRRDNSPTSVAMAALSIDEPGPSFAQMLREGKTMKPVGDAWPSVAGNSSRETTVWGQPRRRQPSVREEADDEDMAFSPPVRSSFNLAEALEMATKVEKETPGRKKKKKQQIVLFAT